MSASKRLSVSQLNGYIKSVFDDELILHNICVYGELSQLSIRENVSYFTITEGGCYINCVMFSAVEHIEIGALVQVYGSVTFYPKSGKTDFNAKSITVSGSGELAAQLNKLKEKLRAGGLFDNRPKPPVYISRAAVITSEAGAVIHDIMSVIRDRNVNIELRLFPASVQGNSAEQSIIEALDKINSLKFDVVVIARGGGSNYDLDVFNGESLARAVAGSTVPVISAIGHETDYTLCDFCAGVRAGTPSIAAAIISDTNLGFLARFHTALQTINSSVDRLYGRLSERAYRSSTAVTHAIDKKIRRSFYDIKSLSDRMIAAANRIVVENSERAKESTQRIDNSINALYEETYARLKTTVAALEYTSPLKALSRGYAKVVTEKKDINGVADLTVGENVQLIFADGKSKAKIIDIERNGKKNESRKKS